MDITVLCVGKLKEKFYSDAAGEYLKRLRRYCRPQVIEVADEKAPEQASAAERAQILEKEGGRLLKHIRDNDFCITLEIEGKAMDSIAFSKEIERAMLCGTSRLVFVIGGSLGLSPAVCKRSDLSLSFSKMTFPHPLMRVILLEQIYRSFRLIRGEPYHK